MAGMEPIVKTTITEDGESVELLAFPNGLMVAFEEVLDVRQGTHTWVGSGRIHDVVEQLKQPDTRALLGATLTLKLNFCDLGLPGLYHIVSALL